MPTRLSAFCANLSVCFLGPTCLSAFCATCLSVFFYENLPVCNLCQPVCLPFVPTCLSAFCVKLSVCIFDQSVFQPICTDKTVCLCAPPTVSVCFLYQSVCLFFIPNLYVCFFGPISLSVYLCQPVCLPFLCQLPADLRVLICLSAYRLNFCKISFCLQLKIQAHIYSVLHPLLPVCVSLYGWRSVWLSEKTEIRIIRILVTS